MIPPLIGSSPGACSNAAELAGALQQTVVAPEASIVGEATLSAPARVEVGKTFEVGYSGPDGDRDMVALSEPKSAPGSVFSVHGALFDPSGKTGKGELLAPTRPGQYEVRYVLSRKRIAPRSALEVTPTIATVHGS